MGLKTGSRAKGGERAAKTPPKPRGTGGGKAGFGARHMALDVLATVLVRKRPLDEALAWVETAERHAGVDQRDRAFARLLVATVLRRKGELDRVVAAFLAKPLPDDSAPTGLVLAMGAAQLLLLATPVHAAIDLSVDLVRLDGRAARFDKLVNAVLRKIASDGQSQLTAAGGPRANIPAWLLARWERTYGAALVGEIATASLAEPHLDLTPARDGALWAARLGGAQLATGSVRLANGGRIQDLAGYADGAWWVQDAAAQLPARLLGDVAGRAVADLCAAPGGKAAQLIAAGAQVTAVDASARRVRRLSENLARLGLTAEIVTSDVLSWQPGRTFDAVLLDAPCSATGTLRRHPDILYLRSEADIAALAARQRALLAHACDLVRPGGVLVYCTCSLEPDEGVDAVEACLAARPDFTRSPIMAGEASIPAGWISAAGDLRTLPQHTPDGAAGAPALAANDPDGTAAGAADGPRAALSGMDGFYACRLLRAG